MPIHRTNKDVDKESNVQKNPSTSMVQVSDDDMEFGDPEFVKETHVEEIELIESTSATLKANLPSPSQATKFLSKAWANLVEHNYEEDPLESKENHFQMVSHKRKRKRLQKNKNHGFLTRVGKSNTCP